jgi:hypothetical protein
MQYLTIQDDSLLSSFWTMLEEETDTYPTRYKDLPK